MIVQEKVVLTQSATSGQKTEREWISGMLRPSAATKKHIRRKIILPKFFVCAPLLLNDADVV